MSMSTRNGHRACTAGTHSKPVVQVYDKALQDVLRPCSVAISDDMLNSVPDLATDSPMSREEVQAVLRGVVSAPSIPTVALAVHLIRACGCVDGYLRCLVAVLVLNEFGLWTWRCGHMCGE